MLEVNKEEFSTYVKDKMLKTGEQILDSNFSKLYSTKKLWVGLSPNDANEKD